MRALALHSQGTPLARPWRKVQRVIRELVFPLSSAARPELPPAPTNPTHLPGGASTGAVGMAHHHRAAAELRVGGGRDRGKEAVHIHVDDAALDNGCERTGGIT